MLPHRNINKIGLPNTTKLAPSKLIPDLRMCRYLILCVRLGRECERNNLPIILSPSNNRGGTATGTHKKWVLLPMNDFSKTKFPFVLKATILCLFHLFTFRAILFVLTSLVSCDPGTKNVSVQLSIRVN